MGWIPHDIKICFASTTGIMKSPVSFTFVEAYMDVVLLYTVCVVCGHANSKCRTWILH